MNTIFYLFTNLFRIIAIYNIIKNYFEDSNYKNVIHIIVVFLYYVLNNAISIYINNPYINLITSILCLFIIASLFKATLQKKAIIVLFIAILLMIYETTTYLIIVNFVNKDNINAISQLMVAILMIFTANIIAITKDDSDKNSKISVFKWLVITIFPLGSIIIICLLYSLTSTNWQSSIIALVLLSINLLVFNLYNYNILIANIETIKEQEKLILLNNAYQNQLETITYSNKKVQMIKHDFKNHILSLQSLVKNNDLLSIEQYLKTLNINIENEKLFSQTGNLQIDSLINYKLSKIVEIGTNIKHKIAADNLNDFDTFSIITILSNALDNAYEALEISLKKEMELYITKNMNTLTIIISNTFEGELKKHDGLLLTTKKDIKNHGIGISSVKDAIKNNNGMLKITNNDNFFTLEIMLYSIQL